jgi:ADP-heptose:LPS heptosyltransferase
MRQTKSNIHLIEAHSQHFFHKIKQDKFKNEIFFSKDEIEQYRLKFKLLSRFSLINPVGKDSYTPNKNWGFDNFQQIVDSSDNINWIQVGISDDKKLLGVLDYRGTTTLRELFYLVSKAEFILANEGLLNHIASAFNAKSYVVHSGFSQTALSKYDNTTCFSNNVACEYSPCWKLDECGIPNKPCINSITPNKVLERIIKDKA